MKKYALIKNGIIHSTFETDKSIEEFPDIKDNLEDITLLDAKDNDEFDRKEKKIKKRISWPEDQEIKMSLMAKVWNKITFKKTTDKQ